MGTTELEVRDLGMDALSEAVRAALTTFECKTPAYGVPGLEHCAACCYGTGYLVTCEKEDALVRALTALQRALSAYQKPRT